MKHSFAIASILAVVSELGLASLPRHCFFVTDLQGAVEQSLGRSRLASDLPTLMAMFEPGMQIKSVVAYLDDTEADPRQRGSLTGLRTTLASPSTEQELQLTEIGGKLDKWQSKAHRFDTRVDGVTILSNEWGVCDVKFSSGVKVDD